MGVSFFQNCRGQKVAYVYSGGGRNDLPTVMFLGGFKSDMSGTKALFLEAACRERGQSFVRFDYTGHGESEGDFEGGTIGKWRDDATEVLDKVTQGDVILVGSSMGGWISLLLLQERRKRIKGVIGIAAAPDFTREVEAQMTNEQKEIMLKTGRLEVPSDYGDEPYVFTRDLIEDGRAQSLLDTQQKCDVPMILLQGKMDADVPWQKALRIAEVFGAENTQVIFIEDGDHRLSREQDLALLDQAVRKLSGL